MLTYACFIKTNTTVNYLPCESLTLTICSVPVPITGTCSITIYIYTTCSIIFTGIINTWWDWK